jgi:hypothetical protein
MGNVSEILLLLYNMVIAIFIFTVGRYGDLSRGWGNAANERASPYVLSGYALSPPWPHILY